MCVRTAAAARKFLCGSTLPTKTATRCPRGQPAPPAVPEWLTSLRAVQGELPAQTRYLTANALSPAAVAPSPASRRIGDLSGTRGTAGRSAAGVALT
jgi:hypothetical protein